MRRFINVLVAAVVLVLTAGLLLAAIPKVREVAARTQCRNNLKQIGIALHNRYETYGSFPPAAIPNEALPCEKRLSWLVEIVPYVEQIRLVIDRKQAWDEGENRIPKVRINWDDPQNHRPPVPLGEYKVFRCPSNPVVASTDSPGLTDYVGISGVGIDAADRLLGYPGVGFFGCDRRLKLDDIKDGTANTIAVVETTKDNGPWTASGFPTVRGLNTGRRYLGDGSQFASGHRSCRGWLSTTKTVMTNVVYGDGSVRYLSDSVSPQVLEALVTIAGGEEVGPIGDE